MKTHTATHRDAMDPTRFLQVTSTEGNKVNCNVLWNSPHGMLFGGKTVLPASLFDATVHANTRVGFIAM